jgi:hypothetical protein
MHQREVVQQLYCNSCRECNGTIAADAFTREQGKNRTYAFAATFEEVMYRIVKAPGLVEFRERTLKCFLNFVEVGG